MKRPVTFIIRVLWSRDDCPPVQALKWILKRLLRTWGAKALDCKIEPETEVNK